MGRENTKDHVNVALTFLFQMGTTTRSFLGRWITPSWWPTPSGCLSGTQVLCTLFLPHTSLPGNWFLSGWGKQHPAACWDLLGIQTPAWCDNASPVTAPVRALPCLHSGIFGERLPLRYYLSGGMMLSGLFTALFGLGYFWDIHVLWYFIVMQVHRHWRTWILPSRPHPAFFVAAGHRGAPISNRE